MTGGRSGGHAGTRKPLWVDALLLVLAGAVFLGLLGLGNWQMRRLDWKLSLIEAVETRAFKPPVAPPTGLVEAERHAYLRVAIEGHFRHDLSRRVKALTDLGPGYWLMTPLESARGPLWINRGFIPQGKPDWSAPEGLQRIEGLLRLTEPKGTLLEANDPAAGRWYARDVAALSLDAGLARTAAYFIDADHSGAREAWPRGGLTVIAFRNNHLSYALTWYAMAGLFLLGMGYVLRERWSAQSTAAEAVNGWILAEHWWCCLPRS
ncbi:MAG: SURF1 family protein, partial [Pseudomonadota bacterium]